MARRRTTGSAHALRGAVPHRMTRRLAAGLAAAFCACALPALAQTPPAAAPGGVERHMGKMVFAELVTPDLAAAERFYGGLFGWTFRTVQAGGGPFTLVSAGARVMAGLVQRDLPQGRHPAWLTCLAVSDVEAADSVAVQGGAKLLYGPYGVATLGREAVLADPQGAVFAVFAASAGDPPEKLAAPGDWIWSSLITTDPGADAAFYKALFGYEVFPLPDTSDAQHLILASGDFARASVNPVPPARPDTHPRWLSYVRVDDVAASAAKVATLGGRVVVPPRIDRHGGRISVVADPTGALFGLMEWSDDADGDAGEVK